MALILIIEDEPELVKILRSYLEKAGYSVVTASRGDQGLSIWEHQSPDLVLLDLNLPGMDGLDVAREIRRKTDTPIIMLTARVEETDRLIGLELGADDYVTKPYSPREVVARVRAVLRRAGKTPAPVIIMYDRRSTWPSSHVLEARSSRPDRIQPAGGLSQPPGRAFSRLQLLEAGKASRMRL